MSCQYIFPTEIIQGILFHADPRDIIYWRTVSKWFRAITFDATLWRALYANAPFPCPPGPSPSQSIISLERILVRSARLAESWTTRPLRDVSSVRILAHNDPGPLTSFQSSQMIRGRWLVVLEAGKRLVLHDIDAAATSGGAPGPRVLRVHEDRSVLMRRVFWTPPIQGHWVLYVLLDFGGSSGWKILEFRLDESGELYDSVTIDRPMITEDPDDCLLADQITILQQYKNFGNSPFFFIPLRRLGVVFDGRTRGFSVVPRFHVALPEQGWISHLVSPGEFPKQTQMVFTDTHAIAFHYFFANYLTILQIFELALSDSSGGRGKLGIRLTHEGMARECILDPLVLKFSIDPITGALAIELLAHHLPHTPRQKLTRVSLTLPKSSPVSVLPLTIEVKDLQLPPETRRWLKYVDVFDDGYARGFSEMFSPHSSPTGGELFLKFAIDTTQDPWVITCSKIALPRWSSVRKEVVGKLSGFDGMRGRLCYIESDPSVIVFDIE